jgi:hypothetical protein
MSIPGDRMPDDVRFDLSTKRMVDFGRLNARADTCPGAQGSAAAAPGPTLKPPGAAGLASGTRGGVTSAPERVARFRLALTVLAAFEELASTEDKARVKRRLDNILSGRVRVTPEEHRLADESLRRLASQLHVVLTDPTPHIGANRRYDPNRTDC